MFTAETSATADQPTATQATTDSQTAYPFRLLQDEKVLGTFPVARIRRPLGKVASFLFVTDSRVIYSAEAKALASSSTHLKEYQVQTVTGVEVGRHRGLGAIGAAAAVGAGLNFLILVILASLAGASQSSYYSSNPFASAAPLLGFLAAASLIIGAVAVIILAHSTAEIHIVGPGESRSLARGGDLAGLIVTFVLLLIFGPLVGLAAIVWAILRELGIFKATDAQLYADTRNVDHISYEVGALIMDVQARGKLAGKE
jgi:hypothetical protein